MNKEILLEKIKSKGYNHQQLVSWVTCLPQDAAKVKPKKPKKGDVYFHPTFGHPCVLLEKKGESWVAGLLTSEPTCAEIAVECKLRFFEGWFTKAIFTCQAEPSNFRGVYENPKHLKEVLQILKRELLT